VKKVSSRYFTHNLFKIITTLKQLSTKENVRSRRKFIHENELNGETVLGYGLEIPSEYSASQEMSSQFNG